MGFVTGERRGFGWLGGSWARVCTTPIVRPHTDKFFSLLVFFPLFLVFLIDGKWKRHNTSRALGDVAEDRLQSSVSSAVSNGQVSWGAVK